MHTAAITKNIPNSFNTPAPSEKITIPINAATTGSIFASIEALLASIPERPLVYNIYGTAAEKAANTVTKIQELVLFIFSIIIKGVPKTLNKRPDIKNV